MPTQPIAAAHCDRCAVSITAGNLCLNCAVDVCHEVEHEAMLTGYVTRSDGEPDDGEGNGEHDDDE